MNDKKAPDNNKGASEEVDLILFFNILGKALKSFFQSLLTVYNFVFSLIIAFIKVFIKGWKIILGILLVSFTIGYFAEKLNPIVYFSEMQVKPYFGSKYQMVEKINYFNALISEKNYGTLNKIFNQDNESDFDPKNILGFDVEMGPETENDRLLQYLNFTKRLDSTRKEEVTYESYLENRSIYSSKVYLITALSNKRDIFNKLEKGVSTAFLNSFSNEQFDKNERIRETQKENLLVQLKSIDSMKRFYVQVKMNESQNTSKQLKLGDIGLSSESGKSVTKEYELLRLENDLRNQLNALEKQKITNNKPYDIISSFQNVGNVRRSFKERYSLIFPALSCIFLCLFYVSRKIITFVNNYEE